MNKEVNQTNQVIKTYSGERVQKAGKELRNLENLNADEFEETLNVLSYWRSIHEEPLNQALGILQDVTREFDKHALFAKRMKRVDSIYFKLMRFETMGLHKMQDIGGCRAVVKNKAVLYRVLNKLKQRGEFQIKSGGVKINDYITEPKNDGYRSVHIIGKFPDAHGKLRFIEVQIRTPVQHYWATSVEIVDLFTRQSIKTNQGDKTWTEFFRVIGDHFSVMDEIALFPTLLREKQSKVYLKQLIKMHGEKLLDISTDEYRSLRRCYQLSEELEVVTLMAGFASSLQWVEEEHSKSEKDGYALIVINIKSGEMTMTIFPQEDHENAEAAYIEEEKNASKNEVVVAMVATPNVGGLKAAYPNFFADSTHFLEQLMHIKTAFLFFRTAIHKQLNPKEMLKRYNPKNIN